MHSRMESYVKYGMLLIHQEGPPSEYFLGPFFQPPFLVWCYSVEVAFEWGIQVVTLNIFVLRCCKCLVSPNFLILGVTDVTILAVEGSPLKAWVCFTNGWNWFYFFLCFHRVQYTLLTPAKIGFSAWNNFISLPDKQRFDYIYHYSSKLNAT